jgi:RHS repeat-associated protein
LTTGGTQVETSKLLWAGWLAIMEERTKGVGSGSDWWQRRWFQWGPDRSGTLDGAAGIGGLVAIHEENSSGAISRTLVPADDGLGNTVVVFDAASGQQVSTYEYGPFGELLSESGEADACPFRWQTKFYDAECGHYYFGYRYYDPRLGRWKSRDPLGEAGGSNLYAYCGNDPVNRMDPVGLADYWPMDWTRPEAPVFLCHPFKPGVYGVTPEEITMRSSILRKRGLNLTSDELRYFNSPRIEAIPEMQLVRDEMKYWASVASSGPRWGLPPPPLTGSEKAHMISGMILDFGANAVLSLSAGDTSPYAIQKMGSPFNRLSPYAYGDQYRQAWATASPIFNEAVIARMAGRQMSALPNLKTLVQKGKSSILDEDFRAATGILARAGTGMGGVASGIPYVIQTRNAPLSLEHIRAQIRMRGWDPDEFRIDLYPEYDQMLFMPNRAGHTSGSSPFVHACLPTVEWIKDPLGSGNYKLFIGRIDGKIPMRLCQETLTDEPYLNSNILHELVELNKNLEYQGILKPLDQVAILQGSFHRWAVRLQVEYLREHGIIVFVDP